MFRFQLFDAVSWAIRHLTRALIYEKSQCTFGKPQENNVICKASEEKHART